MDLADFTERGEPDFYEWDDVDDVVQENLSNLILLSVVFAQIPW